MPDPFAGVSPFSRKEIPVDLQTHSFSKHRPKLYRGDLVKRKKPNDDGQMYRVISFRAPLVERKKLREHRKIRDITDQGFVNVTVQGLDGVTQTFKRRDLWRVPNQPKMKAKKKAKKYPITQPLSAEALKVTVNELRWKECKRCKSTNMGTDKWGFANCNNCGNTNPFHSA